MRLDTSGIRLTCEYILVTTDDIRVHTSDIREHTSNIRMTYKYIQVKVFNFCCRDLHYRETLACNLDFKLIIYYFKFVIQISEFYGCQMKF